LSQFEDLVQLKVAKKNDNGCLSKRENKRENKREEGEKRERERESLVGMVNKRDSLL